MPTPASRSNPALLDRYLKHLARTCSPNTVYLYGRDLGSYVQSLRSKSLLLATPQEMYVWIDRPRSKARTHG